MPIKKFSLVILIIVLLMFLLVACSQITSSVNKRQTDQANTEQSLKNDKQVAKTDETEVTVGRSETKEITTYPEGMKQTDIYQLVASPSLPFSTYIPKDWNIELISDNKSQGVRLKPPVGNEKDYIAVVFFKENMDKSEVEQIFENILKHYPNNKREEKQYSPLPDSTLSIYTLNNNPGGPESIVGNAILGKYGSRYFYILNRYRIELGDGWAKVQGVVFDEWKWEELK